MKTMVKIYGKELWYDLVRVHYINELVTGNLFIIKHPETHELCRAKIIARYGNGISVHEDSVNESPYRWFIHKSKLFNSVFLIKKQYQGRQ